MARGMLYVKSPGAPTARRMSATRGGVAKQMAPLLRSLAALVARTRCPRT